ncbi:class III signal peptide [Thermococci archaeon]|nr:MAG: class III signal peptide [Thermococci archaeon]
MKRKAQGAIEYLFMIAAALIIVAIVIRYLRSSSGSSGSLVSEKASQIESELSAMNATTG